MITYNPLWKLLVDKGLNKQDLQELIGCSPTTIAKMGRNEYVSMVNIDAICFVLNCTISDIIEYEENGNPKENYRKQ